MAALRPQVVELAAGAERREREARGDALGHADDVGLDVVALDREPVAGATEPALHLVGDEEDPVLLAALGDALDERRRRGHVAALAEHGLDDHRGRLGRRGLGEQQPVERRQRAVDRGLLVGRERVGERAHVDASRAAGRGRRGRPVFDVVIAIAMWVRPWNDPWNTTMFGRLVACFASFTAASVISAPELA